QSDRPVSDPRRGRQARRGQLFYADAILAANPAAGAPDRPVWMRPPMLIKSLSARLLVLTVFFVMLSEVLIFVPSVARYRMTYFDNQIAAGNLATLALVASPTGTVDKALNNELLRQVGAHGVIVHRADGLVRMLGMTPPPQPDVTFDLAKGNVPLWIQKSF